MVEMEPIVVLQLLVQHLPIPDLLEFDPGIVQRYSHRIVPGRRVRRGIDGHLRRFLQRNGIHVPALEHAASLCQPRVVERLHRHTCQCRVPGGGGVTRQEERSASEVEKPLSLCPSLEGAIRQSVGLEMIGLGIIHGNQQPGRRDAMAEEASRQDWMEGCQSGAGLDYELPTLHVRGTAPLASSSLRRAWGTRALWG